MKDNAMSGGLIFLKAREFGRLFSLLFWGMGIPGTLAIGFYILSFIYGMPFILVSVTLAIGFMFMTYVTLRLSFIIGGD
ncbi:MAG: hypothetical protein HZB92_05580 [Euryarchaeota archaeon]|nr:hypothetical protein [Euryarchaeota archaeon]